MFDNGIESGFAKLAGAACEGEHFEIFCDALLGILVFPDGVF